ncbi:MAG: carboxyl-terminal processing protease [Bacillota bacterium]|nr:MAG: carboxyl-terminal processing protease [Bacillota bacterium]MBS3950042.1 PDZ domain-containing protein [Peptococcaceae bacterium]
MDFKNEENRKQGLRLSLAKVTALCLVFLVIGFVVGSTSQFLLGPAATNILAKLGFPVNVNLAKLISVQNLVLDRHVYTDLEADSMMENAIRGLLSKVDGGFTRYESTEEARRSAEQSSGEYAGIGVTVRLVEEQVHIESVFRGSPAQASGILPKDIIVGVEGESIRGMALIDVTSRIKGPVGTPVNLTIYRPSGNLSIDVKVTRDRIIVPVVEYEILSPDLAHVVLTQFTTTATEQMRLALSDLEQKRVKHVLLDLRFNPGGYTNVVEAIAGFLLDPNQVIYKTVDRNGGTFDQKTLTSKLFTGGVTVLINGGSASASEILAGALRDNRQTTILGTTSYGKGTVQQGYPLGDGSRVWVTVQTYRTPAGMDINKVGIEPDVVIPAPDTAATTDKQLEDAIQYVRDNFLR